MSLAIIDAREWQRMFDLRTGEKVEEDNVTVRMVKGVLSRHPFPGDLEEESNRWVTEVALDFIREYDPQFVYLTYAQQYYSSRFTVMTPEKRSRMLACAAREVERFIESAGFAAVMVGTGDMVDLTGFIDVTKLDGLAVSTNWSTRYAGLHDPSSRDLTRLKAEPSMERIVPREDLVALFDGTEQQAARVPEYLLVAKEGYTFKTAAQVHRMLVKVPAVSSRYIPVSNDLAIAREITDIRGIVGASLKKGRTALITLEGMGMEEFPWSHTGAANGRDWFFYEPGDAQCLTIASGEHRIFDYPTGYKYFEEVMEKKDFPLSGYFTSLPENTIGHTFPGRSIAVGNRSMFTHMVPGADISLEGFARNLYNQGTMAVIHRQGKL
jgi:hypothetical protein